LLTFRWREPDSNHRSRGKEFPTHAGLLMDIMASSRLGPDEAVRNRILVEDAAKLYDFPRS
jgi:hypothetical protein